VDPTHLENVRSLVPGLRLWRNRLRAKLEHSEPGPYQTLIEEEFDECVTLLKGLLSIAGDPGELF
jgi:hypothetical protein